MPSAPTRCRIVRPSTPAGAWEIALRPPAPALAGLVRDMYGYVERAHAPIERLELPGPLVNVIIEMGPPIAVRSPGRAAERFPAGFVAGLDDGPTLTAHEGLQRGVQLTLTPLGAHAIFGVSLAALARRVVPLDDLWPEARSLPDRLASLPDWDARFDVIDALLASRLARAPVPDDRGGLAWALDRIERSGGAEPVRAIAAELGWSHRHLVQQFHERVGLTPKLVARLVRFDRLIRHLKAGHRESWADLAARFGYYDQSHLVHEMRQFAGATPTETRGSLFVLGPDP